MTRPPAVRMARAILARHSRSFALAAQLLPPRVRLQAAVVYSYCRRADDAIDLATRADLADQRLRALLWQLDAIYAGERIDDPLVGAFQRVVLSRHIPRYYPEQLLRGLEMDVRGTRYETLAELERYCFRVAGTVGLMMCHLMGVRHPRGLRHAAHLGMAMQLTNICRDVAEDWQRGRLYLPTSMLWEAGARGLHAGHEDPVPFRARDPIARVVHLLLDRAEGYYRSADEGLGELSRRCSLAVGAARLIYAQIGNELRARRCDPFRGRVVVGGSAKLLLVLQATVMSALTLPSSLARPSIPALTLEFSGDLCLPARM